VPDYDRTWLENEKQDGAEVGTLEWRGRVWERPDVEWKWKTRWRGGRPPL